MASHWELVRTSFLDRHSVPTQYFGSPQSLISRVAGAFDEYRAIARCVFSCVYSPCTICYNILGFPQWAFRPDRRESLRHKHGLWPQYLSGRQKKSQVYEDTNEQRSVHLRRYIVGGGETRRSERDR